MRKQNLAGAVFVAFFAAARSRWLPAAVGIAAAECPAAT